MDGDKAAKKNKEIDIIGIFLKIVREWRSVAVFVLAFAVLGVVVALTTSKQYTTTVLLAPESSSSSMEGALGSFGSLLGLKMGGTSSDAIFPELYPNIFTSTNFLVQLYDVPVTMKDYQTVKSYYTHLKNDYIPPFWMYPKIWISEFIKKFASKDLRRGNGLDSFHLTKEQAAICELMMSNIQCNVDQRTSLITLSVTDIDEVVAACMADTLTWRLQQYITEYRTKKAIKDYEFIQKIYEQTKNDYLKAQEEYARFVDSNMNVVLSRQKSKLTNLENEMQLRLNLYTEMSQQLQIAYQRIQERTPVFSVIQPATVSLEASSMPRKVVVILFAFLGFIIGSVWSLYIRNYYEEFKRKRLAKKNCNNN